jgi:DNA polymerase
MKELEAQVKTCQLCRLAKTRTNAVPGEGNIGAEVMFIGEGPGYHEDKQGRPFVGAAGQFLNELLQIAGLSRESVYIANVVKCRPPNNRDPEPDEKAACAPYLERQIALINPRVIVTLGRHSMAGFFPGERISQIHGTASVVDGRLCVAMYHPAAGLHQASLADIIRADFRKLPIYLEQAQLMASPPKEVVREQVAQAESARESVIHREETAVVLEAAAEPVIELKDQAQVAVVAEAPAVYSLAPEPEQPAVEQAAPEAVPVMEKAKAPTRARKPRATKEEYKQLSFFDL